MNDVEADRSWVQNPAVLDDCLHCFSGECDHVTQFGLSSVDCRALAEATNNIIAWEGALNEDLGKSDVQERLLGIRNARARCHLIAASLWASLRSAVPGREGSCEALRQYLELVATDEFELALPAPILVKASSPRSDTQLNCPIPGTSKN